MTSLLPQIFSSKTFDESTKCQSGKAASCHRSFTFLTYDELCSVLHSKNALRPSSIQYLSIPNNLKKVFYIPISDFLLFSLPL